MNKRVAERFQTAGRDRKTSVDLRDIGAVGYEIAFQPGQPPVAIDARLTALMVRFQFLNSIFQPGLLYSMLVNELAVDCRGLTVLS